MWRITNEDRETYNKIFQYFDKNQNGSLTDVEMQGVMA
jgi:Ca2+-binding EF-hand superfamily protein